MTAPPRPELLAWFDDPAGADRACLGGKSASLGEMARAGLPVPPGFTLTAHAFRAARDASGTSGAIAAALDGLDPGDQAGLSRRAAAARELIASWPVPQDLAAAVAAAYRELCARSGHGRVAVAVRSSATCEDSPDASFAGEHDSYLWVRGPDDVLAAVRRCWASLFTDRAVAYRAQLGYPQDGTQMCVAVQQMVRPRSAGVAFTLNPGNGDRSAVAIDSAWGFGEGVVSGEVTPDNFLVDKVLGVITQRTVSAKQHAWLLADDDQVRRTELDETRASAPSLTDTEIVAVARLARAAERHYGCPQDVEWAVDGDREDSGQGGASQHGGPHVVLLQSRPETVWSKKKVTVSTGLDPMASIVATLSSPLHARKP